jgi:phosphate transport system protein
MSQIFFKEIEDIKGQVLNLGTLVEENLYRAIQAVESKSKDLAQEVVKKDEEIDKAEIELEEEVLKLLALHQPLATDLRYLITVLKMNDELERIGDLAVNVAERATSLADSKPVDAPFDFGLMSSRVCDMLKKSLDALIHLSRDYAVEVFALDDEVDKIHINMYKLVKDGIRNNIDDLDTLVHYLSISKHLERIADHAESISEEIIYLLDGEIVRHNRDAALKG